MLKYKILGILLLTGCVSTPAEVYQLSEDAGAQCVTSNPIMLCSQMCAQFTAYHELACNYGIKSEFPTYRVHFPQ